MNLCSLSFHTFGTCEQCKMVKAIKRSVKERLQEAVESFRKKKW